MNAKELKEISVNMRILAEYVVNRDLEPESVANIAISFCAEMFKNFPKILEWVDDSISNIDAESSAGDFSRAWDLTIQWEKWKKEQKLN